MGAAWLRSLQQGFISQRKSSGWKLPLCHCNKCSVKFISLSILALEITFLPLHFEAMEVEMQLCCHLDRARCACWKKKLSLLLKLLQRTELFLCVFFVFFVVYFVFRFLPLRLTQNHPDAKKFFSFSSHYLTNICWSHHQWLHIKWVKITNIKMGSPSKISPFKMYCSWWVQSISRVATLTCAKNTIE